MSTKTVIKYLICLYVAVQIGSFANAMIENDPNINIWLARACGCAVSAIAAVPLYYLFLNKRVTSDNH